MLPPWGLLPGDLNRLHEERYQRLKADWSSDLGAPVERLTRAIAKQASVAVERLARARTRGNAERATAEPEIA